MTTTTVTYYYDYDYTVSQKNIPNIFDCHFKTSYQILIIFGTNTSDTSCLTQVAIKWPFSFPPHPLFISALTRESRSSKVYIEINGKPERNISDIIDYNLKKD